MPGKPAVSKPSTRVAFEERRGDAQFAGAIVGHEEDRAAAFVGGVVAHDAACQVEREQVAVEVDRAPATAAWRTGTGRVGAVPDRRCCA